MKNNKSTFILKRLGFAAFATIIGGGGPLTIGLLQGKCIEDASNIVLKKYINAVCTSINEECMTFQDD